MSSSNQPPRTSGSIEHYDAVVIGAGVSGMYALHHLREMGFSVRVYDGASDVGGTWWYNRYPGARVDGPGSPFYCYTFSDELMNEWDWAETQSEQSAVLAYLEHVADRFDLRRDIQFETWVQDARYDEAAQRWTVETSTGVRASAQFLICAVGALSTANMPDIPGIHDFAGECYHTGRWPHEPVSFEGKRVAVIGTGSSGIQAIPEIAREAAHVTVLQRTRAVRLSCRQSPDHARRDGGSESELGRRPRDDAREPRRLPLRDPHALGARGDPRGARRALREAVAARELPVLPRQLQRHRDQRGSQPDDGRLRARQDPRDRARPRRPPRS